MEVGIDAGGILNYFNSKNNKIIGVDYNNRYIDFGKSKGLNLIHGDINFLIRKKAKAGIIIYSHTLKHIPNINFELINIKKVLKNDGLFCVLVPAVKNFKTFFRKNSSNSCLLLFIEYLKQLYGKKWL